MLTQGGWGERAERAFISISNLLKPLGFLLDLSVWAGTFVLLCLHW